MSGCGGGARARRGRRSGKSSAAALWKTPPARLRCPVRPTTQLLAFICMPVKFWHDILSLFLVRQPKSRAGPAQCPAERRARRTHKAEIMITL